MKLGGRAILLSLMLAAVCVNAAQRGAQPSDGSRSNLKAESEQLFTLANQARAQAKVRRLLWDPALADAALKHCLRLVAAGADRRLSADQHYHEPPLFSAVRRWPAHNST